MIYVFLLMLIGSFLYLGINFLKKRDYTKKELIIIFSIITLALCGIGYSIVPGRTNDLFDHFETITKIKTLGFFTETSVDNIFIIKILFFIISLINNYHLLSMFVVLFTYSIFFFLLMKYYDNYKLTKLNIWHILLLFFGLCNFYYISTGIKTPIAYSCFALEIYMIEQNKKKVGYSLMCISIFCHGSSLILIALYFLSKLKVFRTKYRYLLLLTFLVMNISGIILSKIPISIISYIGNKIMMYVNRGSFLANPIVLIIEILFGCLFIYRCAKVIKYDEENDLENTNYIYYIQTLSLLGIGTILITDVILERMLMLIAFIVPILIIKERKMKIHRYKIIDILCSLVLIAYYFVRMINHVTFL